MLYVQLRGNVRHKLRRLAADHANVLAPYNTLGMYRGLITTDGQVTVATHKALHAMGQA